MDFDTMVRWSQEFSLVWFFLFFVAVLIWAFWPGNKKDFDEQGRVPLEEGDDPRDPTQTKDA